MSKWPALVVPTLSSAPWASSKVRKKTPTDTLLLTYNLGVNKIDIDLEKQEVVVDTELARDTVLEAIKKTGKKVNE